MCKLPFNKDNDRWTTKIRKKKRQRVDSSDAEAEANEEAMDSQDGALISLTVITQYQALIAKIMSLEDKYKASDSRILNLEARLDEAQTEIDSL